MHLLPYRAASADRVPDTEPGASGDGEADLPEIVTPQNLGRMWASSMGLTFAVAADVDVLHAVIEWGDDLGQVGLTVPRDPGLGVGYAVGRIARGLERGLGAEHPDEVAIARPARARREPLLRAVPRSEEVTLDQALQLAADLVRRGGSELLRHIE